MMDRRSLIQLATSVAALVGIPTAAAAARPRPKTLKGFVVTVDTTQRTIEATEGDDGATWHVVTRRKTKYFIKSYEMRGYDRHFTGTKRAHFSDIEEDDEVKVKGKAVRGQTTIAANTVTLFRLDYGY